tara:strand:+ start:57 stop:257 length:201 start_codon:yes stop_codon:yes gene_type:complete
MKEIFKYGDHLILGASLIYIEPIKNYSFMATLLLMHLTLDYRKNGIKLGFSIGDHGLYLRFQIGLN